MATKLTLRLDKHLIESAKEYSTKTGKPVSKIVANLFEIIHNEKLDKNPQVTPATSSLRGILADKSLSKSDYDQL